MYCLLGSDGTSTWMLLKALVALEPLKKYVVGVCLSLHRKSPQNHKA